MIFMGIAQILAVVVFVVMFLLIVFDKIERHYVTLTCAAVTLVVVFGLVMRDVDAVWETLNLQGIFELEFWYTSGSAEEATAGINWATLIFIAGMMVMVEGMARAGFFRWLCMLLAKLVHYKPIPLLVAFMLMSFVLAMFIDSITVILFLAAVTIELAKLLRFNPVPMILSEIFCANLGGSATMCGDPPNIIIGTSLGYSFGEFVANTGVMAFTSLAFTLAYFFVICRKELTLQGESGVETISMPNPWEAIANKRDFTFSCLIFGCAVVLLVTHAQTGLTVAFIGAAVAVVTLLACGKYAVEVLKKVDYQTLLFFIGLFVVVGGLEQTGILEMVAGFIGSISQGNLMLMTAIILWVSGVCSAIVDNIPFAATMVPVISSLAATQGVDLQTLAWSLSMGTDIGGSATPIGASANVVGISVAAKNGYLIGWGKYCKTAIPATILVLLISMLIIFIRYC